MGCDSSFADGFTLYKEGFFVNTKPAESVRLQAGRTDRKNITGL
jgi:hypothetical protein